MGTHGGYAAFQGQTRILGDPWLRVDPDPWWVFPRVNPWVPVVDPDSWTALVYGSANIAKNRTEPNLTITKLAVRPLPPDFP